VSRDKRRRMLVMVLVCVVCVGAATVYIGFASRRGDRIMDVAAAARGNAEISDVVSQPHLMFRSTSLDDAYGRLMLAPTNQPGGPRALTDLQCRRVHFSGSHGICLRSEQNLLGGADAVLFDENFEQTTSFAIPGTPSRAQVAPEGEIAAYTVFVAGHSYAQAGFSTRTAFIETETGAEIGELEQFTVFRDGKVIHSPDFNFWGVTFEQDSGSFYATLGTAGKAYLVKGDLDAEEVTVIAEGIECPALSPDGTRIAFKQRSDSGVGPVIWRVAVLELETLERITLSETRNVDDQVQWLDDEHVIYGLPKEPNSPVTNVWSVAADGAEQPQLLVEGAWSPVVVR
jgi:hypothetical protein